VKASTLIPACKPKPEAVNRPYLQNQQQQQEEGQYLQLQHQHSMTATVAVAGHVTCM
jgi:NADH:ubiquinone oxidoreductase subunit B-like Fe-S oxidoreductase